jgi:glycosyltransferase 2 family protein
VAFERPGRTIVTIVRVARILNRLAVQAAAAVLLAVGAIFLAWALARGVATALTIPVEPDRGWLSAALVVALAYVLLGGVAWWVVIRTLSGGAWPASLTIVRTVALFSVGNLGRYAPGTIWFLATRTHLAARVGLPLPTVAASLALELVLIALAGVWMLALGLLVLPPFSGLRPLAAVVGMLPILAVVDAHLFSVIQRMVGRGHGSAGPPIGRGQRIGFLFMYLGVWLVGAVALWLAVRSVAVIGPEAFPPVAGAWGVAFLAGFAVPFLPSGLGVREGLLTVLLGSLVGIEAAGISAVLFRLLLTAAEALALLICAPGVGAIIERR